jgi:hypothetical protein
MTQNLDCDGINFSRSNPVRRDRPAPVQGAGQYR